MQLILTYSKPMLFVFLLMVLGSRLQAQELQKGQLTLDVEAGTKIGGASPMGLPAEIRKINSYKPALPFFVGAKVAYGISEKWGIRTGFIFEGKGMKTDAQVKGYKTTFNADEDPNQNVSGYYYGDITTNVENLYLTVPILANYQLNSNWSLQAGPYISMAVQRKFYGLAKEGYIRDGDPTGEKVGIVDAAYDFKKHIRKVDVGISLGGKYDFAERYYATAQFDYGFNSIMKTGFESISFDLHNIFLNVGVGMRLW
ncbi:porin family protein [Sphingobacterium lactis]|uniref:Outer membrane protein beta-barrel domain-containing protein n=1 Tax=Sphingobacterium lactis TaxID=797291 RepID=A0A1H6CPC4_9SPHI|nr:porin family protein [Sphingobacterium lactis]SEG74840.1 Outer membrane protein beta-barrel domain-containing protein [Sphingobacterium lactis]